MPLQSPLRSGPVPIQRQNYLRVTALFFTPARRARADEQFLEQNFDNLEDRWPFRFREGLSERGRSRARARHYLRLQDELRYLCSITKPEDSPALPMTWEEYLALDSRMESTEWDEVAIPLLEALNSIPDNERLAFLPAEERPPVPYLESDRLVDTRMFIEASLIARGVTRGYVRSLGRSPSAQTARSDDDLPPNYVAFMGDSDSSGSETESDDSDDECYWSDTPGPNDGFVVGMLELGLWSERSLPLNARGVILIDTSEIS
ncbi:hypothetical protein CC1G_03481 [Coprinopsis cinerea okayama7|uniref:Uncharacterized protein n=1 Tax=Coprinopsis cinerea (strain Okayama-7 / 130 / ATCC MYA-4618 / FGSC 9003) TaxID=240176 RepID=A8NCC3_COPC7|nr:hypothetical protein CC1G_03481 [Coprinopsis cinerea okayama7\|eukprot:XP_001832467.1 hypothetical protein CC1G_03481 [Coprinopsis cinerea okayama7\